MITKQLSLWAQASMISPTHVHCTIMLRILDGKYLNPSVYSTWANWRRLPELSRPIGLAWNNSHVMASPAWFATYRATSGMTLNERSKPR